MAIKLSDVISKKNEKWLKMGSKTMQMNSDFYCDEIDEIYCQNYIILYN